MSKIYAAFIAANAPVLFKRAACNRGDKESLLPLAQSILDCTNYARSFGLFALDDLLGDLDAGLARALEPILNEWNPDLAVQMELTRLLASNTEGQDLFRGLLLILGLSEICDGSSAKQILVEVRALYGADGDLAMTLRIPSRVGRRPPLWEGQLEGVVARSRERGLSRELNARLMRLGETAMREILGALAIETWASALGFSAPEELWRRILAQFRMAAGKAFLDFVSKREIATEGEIEEAQRALLKAIGPLKDEQATAKGKTIQKQVLPLSQEEIENLLASLDGHEGG